MKPDAIIAALTALARDVRRPRPTGRKKKPTSALRNRWSGWPRRLRQRPCLRLLCPIDEGVV